MLDRGVLCCLAGCVLAFCYSFPGHAIEITCRRATFAGVCDIFIWPLTHLAMKKIIKKRKETF